MRSILVPRAVNPDGDPGPIGPPGPDGEEGPPGDDFVPPLTGLYPVAVYPTSLVNVTDGGDVLTLGTPPTLTRTLTATGAGSAKLVYRYALPGGATAIAVGPGGGDPEEEAGITCHYSRHAVLGAPEVRVALVGPDGVDALVSAPGSSEVPARIDLPAGQCSGYSPQPGDVFAVEVRVTGMLVGDTATILAPPVVWVQ